MVQILKNTLNEANTDEKKKIYRPGTGKVLEKCEIIKCWNVWCRFCLTSSVKKEHFLEQVYNILKRGGLEKNKITDVF